MVIPEVREQILQDLEQLPPALQKQAGELVHELVVTPRGIPGRQLLHLMGSLDEQSAKEMEAAIEEAFEQVDPGEW